jgi:hypothetical protein
MFVRNTRTAWLAVPITGVLACASAQSRTVSTEDSLGAQTVVGAAIDSSQLASTVMPEVIPDVDLQRRASIRTDTDDIWRSSATASELGGGWTGDDVRALSNAPSGTSKLRSNVSTKAGPSGTLETLRPGSILTGFLNFGAVGHLLGISGPSGGRGATVSSGGGGAVLTASNSGISGPSGGSPDTPSVPEPDSLMLMLVGLLGLGLAGRARWGGNSRL